MLWGTMLSARSGLPLTENLLQKAANAAAREVADASEPIAVSTARIVNEGDAKKRCPGGLFAIR